MKKKLWLTALLLSGTLISPAAAAETEPSSPVGAVSVLSDDLGAAASAGVIGENDFRPLPAMKLSGTMDYVPFQLTDEKGKEIPIPFGQLRICEGGILETAGVVCVTLPENQETSAALSGLFGGKSGPSAEGMMKIGVFNMMLEKAEPMMNAFLLEQIGKLRETSGEPVPYSIAHIELRSTEALRAIQTEPLIYTTGTRALIYADGWIIPVYLKAYLFKEDGAYRAALLFTNDSEKDAAQRAGDLLMKRLAAEK